MTKPELSRPPAPAALSADRVADWLSRHPEFLTDRPDLAAVLTPPPAAGADEPGGPIDFGRFLVRRLQRDLAAARRGEATAVAGARRLVRQQARVHDASLALIGAQSFERFVETIATDVAVILRLDAVGLCIEAGQGQPNGRTRSGVNLLPGGAVDTLLGSAQAVERCRDGVRAERLLYGAAATLVRSDMLIRLRIGGGAPTGLLALGSRDADAFGEHGGRQQFRFLASVIESTARAWLDLPG